jgi:hypothetical protein
VILWNTRYLQAAFDTLGQKGNTLVPALLRHVAPLGWEHISLTGDYVWTEDAQPAPGLLRLLREKALVVGSMSSSAVRAKTGRSGHIRVVTPMRRPRSQCRFAGRHHGHRHRMRDNPRDVGGSTKRHQPAMPWASVICVTLYQKMANSLTISIDKPGAL